MCATSPATRTAPGYAPARFRETSPASPTPRCPSCACVGGSNTCPKPNDTTPHDRARPCARSSNPPETHRARQTRPTQGARAARWRVGGGYAAKSNQTGPCPAVYGCPAGPSTPIPDTRCSLVFADPSDPRDYRIALPGAPQHHANSCTSKISAKEMKQGEDHLRLAKARGCRATTDAEADIRPASSTMPEPMGRLRALASAGRYVIV